MVRLGTNAGRVALRRQGNDTLGPLTRLKSGSASVTPPAALAANTAGETADITLLGVRAGDHVVFYPPAALETSLTYNGCRVTGRDTVRLRFTNHTGGGVTGATLAWDYAVSRGRAS